LIPLSPARSKNSHHTPIQVRFGDTDALGHVNNASFAQYAETARLDFLAQFDVDVSSIILARLAIDFKSQVRFGDTAHVETRVQRVGRTSIGLLQQVIVNGSSAAEIQTVVVLFDYQRRSSQPIPASFRQQLAKYQILEGT
jgi:acyl-CoA thioester hydrolase